MTDEQIAKQLGRIQREINDAADRGQTAIREAISIIEEMQRDCQRRLVEAQEMQRPIADQRKQERV